MDRVENLSVLWYYGGGRNGGFRMRISTKGRYALRMMIDLAEHENSGYVPLKEIAQRQNISKKYLEQIIPAFNNAEMLKTVRGAQGGYMLARKPEKYTVGEILRLTEGSLVPVACAEQEPIQCAHSADCPTLPVWQGLNRVINEYLDGITLRDIVEQHRNMGIDDYVI